MNWAEECRTFHVEEIQSVTQLNFNPSRNEEPGTDPTVPKKTSQGRFHIKSDKFPILPGEEEEVINPGTHGKALAGYLAERLKEMGYTVPSYFAEDFGWWLEIKTPDTLSNIVLRRAQDEPEGTADFAISVSIDQRKWSWKRFRFADTEEFNRKLAHDVEAIFTANPDIVIVAGNFDSYPDDRINPCGD